MIVPSSMAVEGNSEADGGRACGIREAEGGLSFTAEIANLPDLADHQGSADHQLATAALQSSSLSGIMGSREREGRRGDEQVRVRGD